MQDCSALGHPLLPLHTRLWRPVFTSMLFPPPKCSFLQNARRENPGVSFLHKKRTLREGSTTSHRACTILMLFGSTRDYFVIIRNYVVTIRDYFVTIRNYFVTIRCQFITILYYLRLCGGCPDEFRLPESCL